MVYRVNRDPIIDDNGVLRVDILRVESLNKNFEFQGETSGYITGGPNNPNSDIIEKFPFSSDGNATDVGNLTQSRGDASGQSSISHGYTSAGRTANGVYVNTIDKFSFAVDGNATDVGDATGVRAYLTGQSSASSGYISGGTHPPDPTSKTIIEKFPVSSDGNGTDVGDLTVGRTGVGGQSSSENGYTSGGAVQPGSPYYGNMIDKFPFSSDTNATDVGDLTQGRSSVSSGQSSTTHGYLSGGAYGPPYGLVDVIDKFTFSSDANATDVGNLTQGRSQAAGASSTTHGYTSGGNAPFFPSNIIEKFSFSSDGNATDVGDMTEARTAAQAGQQV